MPIEKEIITTENIINDYKKIFLATIKKLIILLSFILPLSILFVYLSVISTKELKITFTITGFVFLSVLCVIFGLLMVKYKNFKFITKQNFKIEVGTLAEKNELSLGRPCLPSEVKVLTFGKYSEFVLPKGVYYSFSKQFAMREDEIFRSSKIGDEFYLVIDKNNKILMAYNKKFFEFQE